MEPRSPQDRNNRNAIGWALMSQALWLPVLALDFQDWVASTKTDYDFSTVAKLPNQNLPLIARNRSLLATRDTSYATAASRIDNHSGLVLSSKHLLSDSSKTFPTSRFSPLTSLAFAPHPPPVSTHLTPLSISVDPNVANHLSSGRSNNSFASSLAASSITNLYSKSDLLGGPLTLSSLQEAVMPPIAMAERAQLSRAADPLASIPQNWRESMRKALKSLTNGTNLTKREESLSESVDSRMDQARIVHVPSARISRTEYVPLALQSDGTVDILNRPDNPAVLEEIQHWSARQSPPTEGRMLPAIVHLHPLPADDLQNQPTDRTQPIRQQSYGSNNRPSQFTSSQPSSRVVPTSSTPSQIPPPSSSSPVAPASPISSLPQEESHPSEQGTYHSPSPVTQSQSSSLSTSPLTGSASSQELKP